MESNSDSKTKQKSKNGSKFWSMFSLTENGHLKSTTLMYAFAFSFLFVGIYAVMSFVLLGPLDTALKGKFSVQIINILESVIPAVVSTGLCMLFYLIVQNRKLIPIAFMLIFAYAIGILLIILFSEESDRSLLDIYFMFVPAPVLIGCSASMFFYMVAEKNESKRKGRVRK